MTTYRLGYHCQKGGRRLRLNYTVVFLESLSRWVVGCGNFWTGKRRTLFRASRIVERLNERKVKP